MARMGKLMTGLGIKCRIRCLALESQRNVRKEQFHKRSIVSQEFGNQRAIDKRAMTHHHRTAGIQVLEYPYPEILGRHLYVHILLAATLDIIIGRIIDYAPAPQFPFRRRGNGHIHSSRRPLAQCGRGSRHKHLVESDIEALLILESQPVPRLGRELLRHGIIAVPVSIGIGILHKDIAYHLHACHAKRLTSIGILVNDSDSA